MTVPTQIAFELHISCESSSVQKIVSIGLGENLGIHSFGTLILNHVSQALLPLESPISTALELHDIIRPPS
jgi:hypothetical protein